MGIRLQQISDTEIRVELGDRVFVAAALCPHRKGKLVYARVSKTKLRISCPLHHSTFDLATGAVVAGPSCDPLVVRELPAAIWPAPTGGSVHRTE